MRPSRPLATRTPAAAGVTPYPAESNYIVFSVRPPLAPFLRCELRSLRPLLTGRAAKLTRHTARAVARHRELGIAGVALATGMFFVGTGMALSSIRRSEAAGFGDAALAFSAVSLTGIVLFAVLFGIAIANVKKPEIHKRLILVATVSILQAAVGRWFLLFLAPPLPPGGQASPPPVIVSVIPALVADLLIVAAMIHDARTRGSVHRVYWIAGGALLAVQLLRVPLSTSGL